MVYLYLDTKGVQAFLTYMCLGESFLCLFATIFTDYYKKCYWDNMF